MFYSIDCVTEEILGGLCQPQWVMTVPLSDMELIAILESRGYTVARTNNSAEATGATKRPTKSKTKKRLR